MTTPEDNAKVDEYLFTEADYDAAQEQGEKLARKIRSKDDR